MNDLAAALLQHQHVPAPSTGVWSVTVTAAVRVATALVSEPSLIW
jgi:hypothetical protein